MKNGRQGIRRGITGGIHAALLSTTALIALPNDVRAACTTTADCYGSIVTRGTVIYNADGSVQQVDTGGAGGGINLFAGIQTGNHTGLFAVNANDGALRLTANGDITGLEAYGILAINSDQVTFNADGTVATVSSNSIATDIRIDALARVSGVSSGIYAANQGTGSTTITATRLVQGEAYGILAYNGAATLGGLTVDAQGVSGGMGVLAVNSGAGATKVTAADVTGQFVAGIVANNGTIALSDISDLSTILFGGDPNPNATDIVVKASAVNGGFAGIVANNHGTGDTSITATGTVSGGSFGILAYNRDRARNITIEAAAVNGSIVAANAAPVTGGIVALNEGTGGTSITATGAVVGSEALGILAYNGAATLGGLTVDAQNVSGGFGVLAINSGAGTTKVTAADVTGQFVAGIVVNNGTIALGDITDLNTVLFGGDPNPNATDIVVKASAVNGGFAGIVANNHGTGDTSITATGTVSGGSFGILAYNRDQARNITIEAAAVNGSIVAANEGTGGTSITTTGAVVGSETYGILAYNGAATTGGLAIDAQNVSGGFGVLAINSGKGTTQVTVADVSGQVAGIVVNNGTIALGDINDLNAVLFGGDPNPNATDIVVKANAVNGGIAGIVANNHGIGDTSITATGTVSGSSFGILAYNRDQARNITIEAAAVNGSIVAANEGTGGTSITTTGAVVGSETYGILAYNGAATLGGLTVDAQDVSGGFGVLAINSGKGTTQVTVADVSGQVAGIAVNNGTIALGDITDLNTILFGGDPNPNATDIVVKANAVNGGIAGIVANNHGTGDTSITATGTVSGSSFGILAYNRDQARNITIEAAAVNGSIVAANEGAGGTSITATGAVVGSETYGILAYNGAATLGGLTVDAQGVSGGMGMLAINSGAGATKVTAADVSGQVAGIVVNNGTIALGDITDLNTVLFGGDPNPNATDIVVKAGAVNGGIAVTNHGAGSTFITATGMVSGAIGFPSSAIYASGNGQPINILLSGTASGVRNMSGLASDLAVAVVGSPVSLTNEGRMTGGVSFSGAFGDQVINKGVWSVAGASDFGAGVDTVLNDALSTLAASGLVRFDNLEGFTSRGMVTMQNGAAGDRIVTPANVSLVAGSRLAIDINGAGVADSLVTTGTADITGAALDISAQGVRVGRYTVVTADGGLVGTFGSVTRIASAFVGLTDAYDANNAYLDVLRVRDFADAGLTRNQKAAAVGVQSLSGGNPFFAGNPLYDAILALPTDAQARNAFDQLSGEVHASAQTALIENGQFVRDAVTNRVRAAFGAIGASRAPVMAFADPAYSGAALAYAALDAKTTTSIAVAPTTDRFALWGQGFGGWGQTNSDGNAARLNRSTGGFLVGGDAPIFETWRLGMTAGYSRTTFNARDRASSGSSDNYHLGLYGGTQWGNLGLRSGLAYTWHDIATSRSIAFAGFSDSLKADYRAGTAQVFGELGYGIRAGGFGFEPFANLAYVNLSTDSFTERGGAAALRGVSGNSGVTFTTLGVHASTDFNVGAMAAALRGTLGWRHALGDTTPLSTFAFAGGSPFTVAGVPIARDAAVVEAGLDLAVAPSVTVGISYSGQFASDVSDQSVRANLYWKF